LAGLASSKSSGTGGPQIKIMYRGLREFRRQLGLAAGLSSCRILQLQLKQWWQRTLYTGGFCNFRLKQFKLCAVLHQPIDNTPWKFYLIWFCGSVIIIFFAKVWRRPVYRAKHKGEHSVGSELNEKCPLCAGPPRLSSTRPIAWSRRRPSPGYVHTWRRTNTSVCLSTRSMMTTGTLYFLLFISHRCLKLTMHSSTVSVRSKIKR
jgi:hypothetical protein